MPAEGAQRCARHGMASSGGTGMDVLPEVQDSMGRAVCLRRHGQKCGFKPLVLYELAVAQEAGIPKWNPASGNLDQNLRNPPCLILSHIQFSK